MKKHSVGDLNKLYEDADTVDKELFSEQRSNVLLISGEHYNRKGVTRFSQLRNSRDVVSRSAKLRLTKNHVHKVHRRYVSSVLTYASGVRVTPQLDYEMQDQKSAELNQAVWDDAKDRYRLKEKTRRWASDFCGIGEVFVKVFWDIFGGDFVGYEQKLDEYGDPVFNEAGEPVGDKSRPSFTGAIKYERVFGFNLLRDPSVKELEDSPYLIYRKLTDTQSLKKRYAHDDKILKSISDSANEEYIVFDTNRNGYDRAKGKTAIREYYFKPSVEYPEGYFYIATRGTILEEGTLPHGLYPIIGKAFDENQTSPRGRSIIKQARPYQAEINRAASSQAMHQITIGDDKILYQAGTKLTPGALLPGVRGITYQGMAPTILQGRDGAQYTDYINGQIAEMYDVLDVNNMFQQGQEVKGGNDLYALLFRSAVQRQQLSVYSEKFEEFLIDVCTTTLKLAKAYYPDELIIPAIGRREYVNMAEFKSSQALHYKIKIVPQDDTLETQFGKQLTFQHLMQYGGGNLDKQDIGMLMRSMPYSNKEEQFKEYTTDYDNSRNLMLALDRGEYLPSIPEENHDYIIRRLSTRMKQADFRYLPQQVQQMYSEKRGEHQKFAEDQKKLLIAQAAEYIPVDGPMIALDMYVEDKTDPTKAPKRARLPQNAVNWLTKMIEAQSGPLSELGNRNLGELQGMNSGQQAPGQGPMGNNMGAAMPPMEGMQ